jgi:hypothetical protein
VRLEKLIMQRFLNFLILVLCCQVSIANSEGNPNAHTHGLAHMNILYEAGLLLVELETPAANMLGFEHMPQNTKEWQQLHKLEQRLNRPENIIVLTPYCDLQNVDIKLPFTEEKEAKNDKNNEHSHQHHETHQQPTQKNNKAYDKHQNIHLNYTWQCTELMPPVLYTPVFNSFSGFEKIKVQWVSNGKQGARELTKMHTTLDIVQ